MASAFTMYIDSMNMGCGYEKSIQCSRRNLLDLKKIKKFQKKEGGVFGEVQFSEMGIV